MNSSQPRLKKSFMKINILLVFLLLLSVLVVPLHSAANTTVRPNPISKTVAAGSTFTLDILCIPTQSIKSFELRIGFTPSLLKANSVSKGTIFDGYTTYFNAGTIDNSAGTISNIYDVILGPEGVSSTGTLIRISFTAKSTAGTSPITINAGITNNQGYIPISIENGNVQVTQQTNDPPVISSNNPTNRSTNIPITTSSLSVTIRDPDGDSFAYTIQTQPYIGSTSVSSTHNGTKQCSISGLKYATTYHWYVNATDGGAWKRQWFTFTTEQAPTNNLFIFSGIVPGNRSSDIPINTSRLSLMIENTKGHTFDYQIKTSPDVGSKIRYNYDNGIKTCDISGLAYGTTYHWYVSCRDTITGQWVNQSYWFKTETKPSNPPPPGGGGGGGSSSQDDQSSSDTTQNNPPNTPTTPFGPTAIEIGVNYYFVSTSFDPDVDDTIRLRFDWGDGNYSDWTELLPSNVTVSVSHTWRNISSYNISVIAQDQNGLNSSWSDPLTVVISQAGFDENSTILEIFTSSNNISATETIQFNASCCLPSDSIVSYRWEFGDGNTSFGQTTDHAYSTPGQYTVTLEITDELGGIYNKQIDVLVGAIQPLANQDTNILSILLSILLISLVFILIFFLLIFTGKTKYLYALKKYLIMGVYWIQRNTKKLVRTKTLKKYIISGFSWILRNTKKLAHMIYSALNKSIPRRTKTPTNMTIPQKTPYSTQIKTSPPVNVNTKIFHFNDDLAFIHEWIDSIDSE